MWKLRTTIIFRVLVFQTFWTLLFGQENCEGGETPWIECPPWENIPTYFPYPYDCRKFIICTNGIPEVECCPQYTVWDQELTTCNHESTTPCVIVTTTTTTPTTTSITPTPPTSDEYLIANFEGNGVLEVLSGDLTDYNQVWTVDVERSCADFAQIWRLDYIPSTSLYMVRSGLGTGNQQWMHGLHYTSSPTWPTYPYIHEYRSPNHFWDSFWRIEPVQGSSRYFTFQNNGTSQASIRNTGIQSGIGVVLEMVEMNKYDQSQWWELIRCP